MLNPYIPKPQNTLEQGGVGVALGTGAEVLKSCALSSRLKSCTLTSRLSTLNHTTLSTREAWGRLWALGPKP